MIMDQEQKSISDRLVAALQEDEFVLYSQNIVPLVPDAEEWPFQEIFIRFKEEDTKMMPPGSFLPVLDEAGLLPFLDRWVVNRLARWVRTGLAIKPEWKVPRSNVNLSSSTLCDPDFAGYTRKYVDDSYLSNGVLAFEVTWEDVVEHAGPLQHLIDELRPFGCGFTLSGFDGSRASYAVLEALKPEFIKISLFLTGDMDRVPAHAEKVSEISQRCADLGIKAIAERVESGSVLEQLRLTKTDFAQGYGVAEVKML
jgi:EAL domain-containing protein (putative c-di-GMP-specific phosphodiesterase class I)